MLDHGFAGGFVNSPWRNSGGGSSRCLGLRRGGFVFQFIQQGRAIDQRDRCGQRGQLAGQPLLTYNLGTIAAGDSATVPAAISAAWRALNSST